MFAIVSRVVLVFLSLGRNRSELWGKVDDVLVHHDEFVIPPHTVALRRRCWADSPSCFLLSQYFCHHGTCVDVAGVADHSMDMTWREENIEKMCPEDICCSGTCF